MNKLTVGDLLKHGVSRVVRNFSSTLYLGIFLLSMGLFLGWMRILLPNHDSIIEAISTGVTLVLMAAVCVRWYRIEMGILPIQNTIFFFNTENLARMLGAQLLLLVLIIIPLAAPATFMLVFFPNMSTLPATTLMSVCLLLSLYIWHRIPFLLLYAAIGDKLSVKKAWHESRNIWGRLLSAHIAIYLPCGALILALSFGFFFAIQEFGTEFPFWILPIFSVLLNFLGLLLFYVNAAIIVRLYKEVQGL